MLKNNILLHMQVDDNMKLLPFNNYNLKMPRILETLNGTTRYKKDIKLVNDTTIQHLK